MIDRDIKQFVLKALLRAADQPIADETLRDLVRQAFSHVAIIETDLIRWIGELKKAGLIADEETVVFGKSWTLTLKGKPQAKQLK